MEPYNTKKVSLIIPAKNEEANIEKCLNGIESLDFDQKKLEVIVVDNNSTDNTSTIAKAKGAKVIQIKQGTIGELRNRGAEIARGEIFAFIDADCVPDKNWLKNAIYALGSKDVAAVGSKPAIPETGTTWVERTWSTMKQIPEVCETTWLSSCNFIVKRSVFETVNGFDPTLSTCEDADIGYRISRKYKMINDPRVRIIHLGEPKTIKEFFDKERWHGEANFKGLFKHGFTAQEIPSLLFPLLTAISIAWIVLGAGLLSFRIICISFLLFISPPIIQTLKVVKRMGPTCKIFNIFLLFIIYGIARFLAMIGFKSKK